MNPYYDWTFFHVCFTFLLLLLFYVAVAIYYTLYLCYVSFFWVFNREKITHTFIIQITRARTYYCFSFVDDNKPKKNFDQSKKKNATSNILNKRVKTTCILYS